VPERTAFSTARTACELRAKQARLILIETNTHLIRRLDPIVSDVSNFEIGCLGFGEVERNRPDRADIGTADAILPRPTDRWPKLERRHPMLSRPKNLWLEILSASHAAVAVPARAARNPRVATSKLAQVIHPSVS
jgi:hypothetical protein